MATQEKDQICANLVLKLTNGASLDDAEKAHLAACENCMAEVVSTLDKSAMTQNGPGKADGGPNGELAPTRPAAKKALEQGRRVFEREFGISLSKNASTYP